MVALLSSRSPRSLFLILARLSPKTPLDTTKHDIPTAHARVLSIEQPKRPGRRVHSSAVGRFSGAALLERLFRPPPLPSPSLPPPPRAAEGEEKEGRKSGARRTGGSASPLLAPVDLLSAGASSLSSCWRRRGGARSPRGFTPRAKTNTTTTRATTTTTTKSSGVSTSTTKTTMETTSSLSPTNPVLLLPLLRKSAPKRSSTCS